MYVYKLHIYICSNFLIVPNTFRLYLQFDKHRKLKNAVQTYAQFNNHSMQIARCHVETNTHTHTYSHILTYTRTLTHTITRTLPRQKQAAFSAFSTCPLSAPLFLPSASLSLSPSRNASTLLLLRYPSPSLSLSSLTKSFYTHKFYFLFELFFSTLFFFLVLNFVLHFHRWFCFYLTIRCLLNKIEMQANRPQRQAPTSNAQPQLPLPKPPPPRPPSFNRITFFVLGTSATPFGPTHGRTVQPRPRPTKPPSSP